MHSSPLSDSYGISKRPSNRQRKSTLTQQQKNQKRQRATPHQLTVLKSEFEINPTPNAKTREEIGRRIDMTERSVQIWFQNNRAKNKILAKKHGSTFPTNVQYSMGGTYFGNRAILGQLPNGLQHPMGASFPPAFVGNNLAAFPGGHMGHIATNPMAVAVATGGSSGLNTHSHFGGMALGQPVYLPCIALEIGEWRRIISGGNANELIVEYSPMTSTFSYTIFENSIGFRITSAMKCIKRLEFVPQLSKPHMADLIVTVLQSPSFSTQSRKDAPWCACDDFSVHNQASSIMVHRLEGPAAQLHAQLSRIALHEPSKVLGIKAPLSFGGMGLNPMNPIVMNHFAPMSGGRLGMNGTMSEATSPVISSARLPQNIALGIAMNKTRSKSLPSLLLDDSIEDFRNMLETHHEHDVIAENGSVSVKLEEAAYDSALTANSSTESYFINDSVPEVTLSLSSATSTSDSLVDTSLLNLKVFTQSHTPIATTPISSVDAVASHAVSAEDVVAALGTSSSTLLDDSLLVHTAVPSAQTSHHASAAVSPLMQMKPVSSLGSYVLTSAGDAECGAAGSALYEEASGMLISGSVHNESESKSAMAVTVTIGAEAEGTHGDKLLMATSANLLDIEGVLGGSSGDSGSFSGDFDKVLENFGSDNSLFSLIQV